MPLSTEERRSILLQGLLKYLQTAASRLIEECITTSGSPQMSRDAVNITKTVVRLTPIHAQMWFDRFEFHIQCLHIHFQLTNDLSVLQDSIHRARHLIAISSDSSSGFRARALRSLVYGLRHRLIETSDVKDLEEGIQASRTSLQLSSVETIGTAKLAGTLGELLAMRFDRSQNPNDIQEAVDLGRQALRSISSRDHVPYVAVLTQLYHSLHRQYNLTKDSTLLETTVMLLRRALDELPSNASLGLSVVLNCLGDALDLQQQKGSKWGREYLDDSIAAFRQAARLITPDNANYSAIQLQVSMKLLDRYAGSLSNADLDEAIVHLQQGREATKHSKSKMVKIVERLAAGLFYRHQRTGSLKDLAEAIEMIQQICSYPPSVFDTPAGRAVCLANQAAYIKRRCQATHNLERLSDAEQLIRQAISEAPGDEDLLPQLLHQLGLNLYTRCKADWDLMALGEAETDPSRIKDELTEAMDAVQRAVDMMPEGHLHQAATHRTLGLIYMLRASATQSIDDVEKSVAVFTKSWRTTSSVPRWRLQSAGHAIRLSMAFGDVDVAIALGREVMALLPVLRMNTKELTISDRQDVLGDFQGVAMNVCAALLRRDKAKEALQFLEQGRAVLIRQLVDDRLDLSELETEHPDVARRYEEVPKEIEGSLTNNGNDEARETARERRRQETLREIDDLVGQASEIPGQHSTTLSSGQTVEEMQQCAKDGAIVVVNFTIKGCDAIIVTRNCIKAMDLSDTVNESEMTRWLTKKWTGRRSEMARKNKDYLTYLAWIWNSCVRRILGEVRSVLGAAVDQLLRIWWIGSGLASGIPFHAAGLHTTGSTETVYHQTISSYTPSIKALSHARERMQASSEFAESSLALLTMPNTPGGEGALRLSNLPGVVEEEAVITKVVEEYIYVKHLRQPSVAQTVDCLSNCTMVHFACHGISNLHDPSQSALVLQKSLTDGNTKTYVQDCLTMAELSKIKLQRARLAYLSACSTAQSKSGRLRDEVLHVVSGFIIAGVPHTVGCLWQSSDRVCVSVAEVFYTELFGLHGSRWRDDDVARSLREAVMRERAKDLGMPLLWAPFIHYGI